MDLSLSNLGIVMSSLGAGEAGDWGRISKSFSHNL